MGRHTARTRLVLSPVRRGSAAPQHDPHSHHLGRRSTFAVAAALTTMALTTTAAASLAVSAPAGQASADAPTPDATASATPAATPAPAPLSPEVASALQQAAGTLQQAQDVTGQLAVAEDHRAKIAEASAALQELVSGTADATPTAPGAETARSAGTASRASEREPVPTDAAAEPAAALPAEPDAAPEPSAAPAEASAQAEGATSDLAAAILVGNPVVEALTVPGVSGAEPEPVLGPLAAEDAAAEPEVAAAAAAEATGTTSGTTEVAAQTAVAIQEATAALQSLLATAPSTAAAVVPAPPTAEEIAAEQAAQARAEAERLAQLAAATAGYANGQIPTNLLCGLTFAGGEQLRCDAAAQLEKLNIAFRARFGRDLAVSDTYRSYASQVATKAAKGYLAAAPGTSNHGLGLAVDLSGGAQSFGTAEYTWLRENGPSFGWDNPAWARAGGTKPEAWHWEFGAA